MRTEAGTVLHSYDDAFWHQLHSDIGIMQKMLEQRV
jgi:hypothetical protein